MQKYSPEKSNGIKGQTACLWSPTSFTLPANLHAIENQCHALRKNDDGGVSENRNFFDTPPLKQHGNDDAAYCFC